MPKTSESSGKERTFPAPFDYNTTKWTMRFLVPHYASIRDRKAVFTDVSVCWRTPIAPLGRGCCRLPAPPWPIFSPKTIGQYSPRGFGCARNSMSRPMPVSCGLESRISPAATLERSNFHYRFLSRKTIRLHGETVPYLRLNRNRPELDSI